MINIIHCYPQTKILSLPNMSIQRRLKDRLRYVIANCESQKSVE